MNTKAKIVALLAGVLAVVFIGVWLRPTSLAGTSDAGYGARQDWVGHGGADDESGYSALAVVNDANIADLGLAWSLDLPGEVTLEATPLAVNGVLYFPGTYSSVYAVDGVSGKLIWKYDPEIWKHDPDRMRLNFAANRGVAYANGRIFVATFDGRLIAISAKTGKAQWSSATLPSGTAYFSTGAPRAFNGKVIIGNAGGDYGSRGYVTAYDQVTGKQVWRFYTVPGSPEQNKGDPAMESAAKTWSGEYWKTGTGGTVWNGMTFDPEKNRIYIGTGNSGPYDPAVRSPGDGDNLYLVSIVSLDADSGKYVWHYQENPREAWDYKATANIVAATLTIDKRPRKVLLHAPTNGFMYVIDRNTGKPISAGKLGKVTWAEGVDINTGRPIEAPNIRYEKGDVTLWPGPTGIHNWQAMSFNPGTGLAYIPTQQQAMRYSKGPPSANGVSMAGVVMKVVKEDAEDQTASLLAWDPVRQKPAWKVALPSFWNGGTLTTAGNLVFQGTGDGNFTAYNAKTGQRAWQAKAGVGVIAAPISYSVGGRQYISVLAGYGGAASIGGLLQGWKYGAQPRRLLTFTLGGKAALAPTAPPDMTVSAVDDRFIQIDEADVVAGASQFLTCAMCHGQKVVSGGTAPDLRESAVALDFASFRSVVHDGAMIQSGMPRFDNLSEVQLRQIFAYIRACARETLGTRKPVPSSMPTAGHL